MKELKQDNHSVKDSKEMRKIMINSSQNKEYADNTIKTAKYNILTFLPFAVLYQFNNYFNIYFLFTAIILAIKEISPLDPGSAIAPFIIVIAVSVIREGIEDIKKSNYDKTYNNSITTRVNYETNEEEKIKWMDVQVGSILKIKKNENIPADLLVIKSSLASGFCYMETTNLDGESALKPREVVTIFNKIFTEGSEVENQEILPSNQNLIRENNIVVLQCPENDIINDYNAQNSKRSSNLPLDVKNLKGYIEVDQPNFNIYSVNGTIEIKKDIPDFPHEKFKSFFKIDNILLRGTTLKNVDYAYGIVLYTGIDTKIMKNIQTFSLKNSSIEKTLNKVIIVVIMIVVGICVFCTMFGMIFLSNYVPDYDDNEQRAEYIYYAKQRNYPYSIEFFSLFGAFFIMFNNIIPISLTITFEIAKFIQVSIMSNDKFMYNEEKDEKFKILSMKLQEDLGNVKYIFTDKTGTLTKNEMIFRACSIYSKLFFEDDEKETEKEKRELKDSLRKLNNKDYVKELEQNSPQNDNQKNCEKSPKMKSVYSPLFDLNRIQNEMNSDLPILLEQIDDSYYKSSRDVIIEFFLNIALNHNILTEIDEEQNLTYQGTNPDEVTLVTSAKELGIEYAKREGSIITIKIDSHEYKYEVLHKFEFSSERARSSIIVRELHSEEIKLFIKGSDDRILKLLNDFSKRNLENITKEHLDKFSKSGLRTLCYAVRILNQDTYLNWDKLYNEIKYEYLLDKSRINDLEKHISLIENECILLGVSGLEDRLQDNVKETIAQFLEAGIQMWMLTGDKLDTAESIGYSSKLFDEDTEVFKIRNTKNKIEILNSMNKILEDIEILENQINMTKLERKKRKKKNNKSNVLDKEIFISKKEEDCYYRRNKYSNTEKGLELANLPLQLDSNRTDKMIVNSRRRSNPQLGSLCLNKFNSENKMMDEDYDKFSHPNEVVSESNRVIEVEPQNLLETIPDNQENTRDLYNINKNQVHNFAYVSPRILMMPSNDGDVSPIAFFKKRSSGSKKILSNKENLIYLSDLNSNNLRKKINSERLMTHNTARCNNKILSDIKNIDCNLNQEDVYEYEEHPSQVDDVSVMKFMMDKNFFDNSIVNKQDFAHTFMNQIMQIAVSKENSKRNSQENLFTGGKVEHKNIHEQNQYINDLPLSIRLNERNNIEIEILNNKEEPAQEKDVEEIDISNLYHHYQSELKKMEERKNSVQRLLKFTNFNFRTARKKKTEEEEHDIKDINLLNFGLIIEGNAISICLDEEIKPIFWKLIKKSRAIICCRSNPIQKSDVVNFVKHKSGEVCLAIGDGGNDVNMIKSANVGIGIFGKEGYQAAFSSDYAISQFKYLSRLLFYHGRYSLYRNSYFIYFFFYKSLIFNVPNLWFAFFNGFSGATLWDSLYFMMYTSLLSTMPPVVIMVYGEDIDITFEEYRNKDLLIKLVPDIYKEYRDSSPFNSLKFFIVFMLGIIHSAVIYFFPLFVFRFGNQDHYGRSHTIWDQSLLGVLTVLFVQYYIIFQDTFLYSKPVIIAHTAQLSFNLFFFLVYGFLGNDQLGAYTFDIVDNVKFWFTLIITLAIDLLCVIISRKIDIILSDNIINNLRNRKYEDDYLKKLYIKKLEHMAKCTRSIAKFKKIYKQIDQYQAENYADRKMKDFVEMYRKNKKKDFKSIAVTTQNKSKVKKAKTEDLEKKLKEKLKTLNIKIKNIKSRGSRESVNQINGKKDDRRRSDDIIINRQDQFTAYGIKPVKTNNENIDTNLCPESTAHRYTESDQFNLISNKELQYMNPTAHIKNNKSHENSKEIHEVPEIFNSSINNVNDTNSQFDIEKEVEVYEDIETKVICFPGIEDLENAYQTQKQSESQIERKLSLNKFGSREMSINSREKEN